MGNPRKDGDLAEGCFSLPNAAGHGGLPLDGRTAGIQRVGLVSKSVVVVVVAVVVVVIIIIIIILFFF